MSDIIAPVLNIEEINKTAQEAAEKAQREVIEKFYNGYDSPYKKKLKEHLENQKMDLFFKLPNVVTEINEALSSEIDAMVNKAIAHSYVPLISECFTNTVKEMKFSEFLQNIVNAVDEYEANYDDFHVSVDKNSSHGWLDIELSTPKNNYSFTLHEKSYFNKDEKKDNTYQLFSLPNNGSSSAYPQKMKIEKDGVTIEMPFVRNILNDKVVALMANMIMADTVITMDTDYFHEDMFPSHHCEC